MKSGAIITAKRSPARICWHVLANGQCIATANTRKEAECMRDKLAKQFCLEVA